MPCNCGATGDNAAKASRPKVPPKKPAEDGAPFPPKFLELTPPLPKPAPAATPAPADKPAAPQQPAASEKPVALRKSMTPDNSKEEPKVQVKEVAAAKEIEQVPAAEAKDGGDADKTPPHIQKMMQEREEGLAAAKAHLAKLLENCHADPNPASF